MTDNGAHILLARQPIYDRALTIVGFELLFRDQAHQNAAPLMLDGTAATSRVLINVFSEGDIEDICNQKLAFVNFTAEALVGELPFSPQHLVVEVLEFVEPTSAVIQALRRLRDLGFRIALDDYTHEDDRHPLLAYADIVKLEYPHYGAARLKTVVAVLRTARPGLQILAEKIETWSDMESCRAAGCDLFQGYFMARPELVHGRRMPVDQLRLVQLLTTLNDPAASVNDITALIRSDPFLSLRILKLVNSAMHRQKRTLSTLNQAVMALGLIRIRAFASLLALSKMQEKPHALRQLIAVRSLVCQTLCERLAVGADMGFTVGLFPCLDALFDRPLADILARLSLDPQIDAALVHHEGELGVVLHAVVQHEKGEFEAIRWSELAELGITPAMLMDAFRRSLMSADAQAVALG